LAACVLCLFIYTILRPLEDVNLDVWLMKLEHIPRLLVAAAAFVVVAYPLAKLSGFIHIQVDVDGWESGIGMFTAMFFIDGLVYELMYRGCFQNVLHSNVQQRKKENDFFCPSHSVLRSYSNFTDDEMIVEDRERRFSDASQDLIMDIMSNENNSANLEPNEHMPLQDENRIVINETTCQKIIRWFFVGTIADVFVIICSSIFFAFASTDYGPGTKSKDVIRYWFIIFWLGMCSGWLWYHTKHVVWCALFYTTVMYLGEIVLGITCSENTGLCAD